MPVQHKVLPITVAPFELFLSLAESPHPFILDSGLDPERLGRYSFVGAGPFLTMSGKGNIVTISRRGKNEIREGENPFLVLRELLQQYWVPSSSLKPPFIGGAVGYLGYELGHFMEKLPSRAVDDIGAPDCFFGFYDGVYAFDYQTGTVTMTALGLESDATATLKEMESHLLSIEKKRPSLAPFESTKPVRFCSNMTKESYLAALLRIKEYIHAGDIYQVNFTQCFDCPFEGDPLSLYAKLRSINPAPFSAFIDAGECKVLSSSPERFLHLRQGKIETRPIKGTCRRGKTDEEDAAMRRALLESEKDRAELLMIVDLERNDLGRVAKTGTVKVPELFAIETYPTLHHLVATVVAEVRPECDAVDCIEATFPGGSITGAPKIRAMEIIDELEPTQRGVYTGSIGYIGFDGTMDLNIAIRTVVLKGDRAYLQVGGGITWDSDPEAEYEECLVKAKALIQALSEQGGGHENL